MRWFWWLGVIGLLATAMVWAAYVTEFYLFLAHAFLAQRPENHGEFLADAQAYLVAFGPLGLGLVVLAVSILRTRRTVKTSER